MEDELERNVYKNVDIFIDKINSELKDYLDENGNFNSDIIYRDVNIELDNNMLKIRPSNNDSFLSIYNINNIGRIRICPSECKIKK